jgi:hypothetical protein
VWWAGPEATDIYLGTRCLAVFEGQERVFLQSLAEGELPSTAFDQWIRGAKRRARIRVWVSGGLCRAFLVASAPQLKSRDELVKVAQAMAPASTGLSEGCRVWVDGEGGPAGTVATAMDRVALEAIVSGAKAGGLRVLSIRPWWAELLRAALVENPALRSLAVRDCDSVTVLAGEGSRIEQATTQAPILDQAAGAAAIRRMLMLSNVAPGACTVGRFHPDGNRRADRTIPVALGNWAEFEA